MVERLCRISLRLSCAYANFVINCYVVPRAAGIPNRIVTLCWSSSWYCVEPLPPGCIRVVTLPTCWVRATFMLGWFGFVVGPACVRQWPLSQALVSYMSGFVCLHAVCALRCDMIDSLALCTYAVILELLRSCDLLRVNYWRRACFATCLLHVCITKAARSVCMNSVVRLLRVHPLAPCLPRVSWNEACIPISAALVCMILAAVRFAMNCAAGT